MTDTTFSALTVTLKQDYASITLTSGDRLSILTPKTITTQELCTHLSAKSYLAESSPGKPLSNVFGGLPNGFDNFIVLLSLVSPGIGVI